MLSVILSGCGGHMGRAVEELCGQDPDTEIVAGFDVQELARPYPIFSSPEQFSGQAGAVIDFSSPAALEGLLSFAKARRVPLVLATTGYSSEQEEQIALTARQVPIFRSGNMSLGLNLLLELVRKAASVLGGDYDIEIVERHHRRKVDAPSGTALMIAAAAGQGREAEYVYERHSVRRPRQRGEIGISSVRGGTIVGEHEIIFAGHDELIEIRHSALSREIFAQGALRAAKFIASAGDPGLYDMGSLVKNG